MRASEYSEEKRKRGNAFHIEYYYLSPKHPQYIMPPHWHNELELLRVISGDFTLHLNNNEFKLASGDIIMYGSKVLHRGEPKDCVYECLVFDGSALERCVRDRSDGRFSWLMSDCAELKYLFSADNKDLLHDVNRLFDTMKDKGEHRELKALSYLFSIFHELCANEPIFSSSSRERSQKQTMTVINTLSWIEEHFSEQITLNDLSRVAGLNEKYFCRIFKEYTSLSPMSYVNEYRIEMACHQMTYGGKSVTRAAYDCGFNDSGYFSRYFKKIKGVSPRQYQKFNKR